MEAFLFWLFAGLMVLGSLMTIIQRSAVVSAVWLVFAFISASGIFALLNAPFLAVMQVLVYAGAIMVLFIFVIMMLQGPDLEGEKKRISMTLWPAIALPAVAIFVMLIGYFKNHGLTKFRVDVPTDFGSPEHVASLLLGKYLMAFELISIVLLVAVIGALALGKEERKLPWK